MSAPDERKPFSSGRYTEKGFPYPIDYVIHQNGDVESWGWPLFNIHAMSAKLHKRLGKITIETLIGTHGTDVIFEGEQVGEFVTLMQTQWRPADWPKIDYSRMRTAKRITGTESYRPVGEIFGRACGRDWAAEY